MISQNFVAALDDLLQVGAQASASLRATLEQKDGAGSPLGNVVDSAAAAIANAGQAQRTEQTVPALANAVATAVAQLVSVAQKIGDTELAQSLNAHLQSARASGIGGLPWLTILGVGAGAIAVYYAWRYYTRPRKLGTIERPELPDNRGRLQGMRKSLGRFKASSLGSCRGRSLGHKSFGRGRLGAPPEKYEFEPEIRLEGYRRRLRKGARR